MTDRTQNKICFPDDPHPEEELLGRHPLVRPIYVEGKITVYYCTICTRRFIIK